MTTFPADDENGRTRFDTTAKQAHGSLRARDDVRCLHRKPQLPQVLGDSLIGAGRVVGDEPQTPLSQPGQALYCPRQRTGSGVDNTVEVGQDHIHPIKRR